MSTMSMYIISNGELAREALNAVVTLLETTTFATAIKISVLFAILGTVINYVRGKDVAIFVRWFFGYFAITAIMVGPIAPRVNLQIIDGSNQGAVYTVGNVPIGLAYPASLITSTAHGLITVFEEAFHMPNDLTYNKTGMLFGSKLFRLSTEFHVINPEVKAELNEYVKNCVIGDILMTKKYSMMDLTESTDLLETITRASSNIRGIYIGNLFKTCRAAAVDLKNHIERDAKENGFKIFGKRIFKNSSSNAYSENEAANKLQDLLKKSYSHFNYDALSNSALQIMTQNLLINGIRDGLLNYTAESGATAALLNYSTTKAMQTMRMKLATSRNIATYTIPLMHTILLLLMISLFPIMVLIAFQPSLTGQVLKNYLYTLIWIESWPIMFACLNMVVTFYAKEIGSGGLTMSNMDQLALEHSDISNMAGYLMLSIPFISGGLVKGMSSAFNHAASYIGGVMQSSAASAASEASSGNISLGNSSWNNVNANKFDVNSSLMKGMATEQLETGVLRTSRPDSETTYDGTPAISRLPTSVRSSDVLSSSLSEQAEVAETASIQDQKTYDQTISSASSNFSSLSKSLSSGKSMGEGSSSREASSAASSASRMWNTTQTVARRNDVSVEDALKGLVNINVGGTFGAGISSPKMGGPEMGIKGKMGAEGVRSSETSTRSSTGRSININAEEAQRFSEDLHRVEEYSKTHHADTSNSAVDSQLSQLSTDLRGARTASEQYAVHKSESERLSKAASYVRQHSSQIDSDYGQKIANYTVKKLGRKEAETLFAGKNIAKLKAVSREYISNYGVENGIMSRYQEGSFGINPSQKYQSEQVKIEGKKGDIGVEHAAYTQGIKNKELEFDQQKFSQLKDNAENNYKKFSNDLKDTKKVRGDGYYKMQNEVAGNIKDGEKKSKSSAFSNEVKPRFLKSNVNENKGKNR